MRRAIQDLLGWWVGCESQGSKRVHDQVYPEELHSLENGLHIVIIDCSDERQEYSGDVDGDLELVSLVYAQEGIQVSHNGGSYLQKLLDGIVDSAPPLERSHN